MSQNTERKTETRPENTDRRNRFLSGRTPENIGEELKPMLDKIYYGFEKQMADRYLGMDVSKLDFEVMENPELVEIDDIDGWISENFDYVYDRGGLRKKVKNALRDSFVVVDSRQTCWMSEEHVKEVINDRLGLVKKTPQDKPTLKVPLSEVLLYLKPCTGTAPKASKYSTLYIEVVRKYKKNYGYEMDLDKPSEVKENPELMDDAVKGLQYILREKRRC